jgi:hypothetical protein
MHGGACEHAMRELSLQEARLREKANAVRVNTAEELDWW